MTTLPQWGLTAKQAAAVLGIPETEFAALVDSGEMPPPYIQRSRTGRAMKRWDLLALRARLDELQGLGAASAPLFPWADPTHETEELLEALGGGKDQAQGHDRPH